MKLPDWDGYFYQKYPRIISNDLNCLKESAITEGEYEQEKELVEIRVLLKAGLIKNNSCQLRFPLILLLVGIMWFVIGIIHLYLLNYHFILVAVLSFYCFSLFIIFLFIREDIIYDHFREKLKILKGSGLPSLGECSSEEYQEKINNFILKTENNSK